MVKVSKIKIPVTLEIEKSIKHSWGIVLGVNFGLISFCIAGIIGIFTVGFLEMLCLAVFCGILACMFGVVIGDLWTLWRGK